MANPTRSCLQHYGYVGSGHYYIAQYYVTASFDPMAMVRSCGYARFYGSVVPRRPSLWFYGMTSLDPMSSRKCGVQYYGSMDLWYVWSYPMSGSVVCLVLSYVWIYGMCGLSCVAKHYGSVVCLVLSYAGPYYDGMVCVALSYVAQACDPMVCAVLSYAAPGRRRASTYFAQSHQTSAYVRLCGPHRTILGPRSVAWRPGGQRSRQGAPTLPCLIEQLGKVESYAYLQSARVSSRVGPSTRAVVRALGGRAAGRFENRNVRGGGNALFDQSRRGAAVASLGSFRPMGGQISVDRGYFCNFGQTVSSQYDSGMR
jgi:hypothetical protein